MGLPTHIDCFNVVTFNNTAITVIPLTAINAPKGVKVSISNSSGATAMTYTINHDPCHNNGAVGTQVAVTGTVGTDTKSIITITDPVGMIKVAVNMNTALPTSYAVAVDAQ